MATVNELASRALRTLTDAYNATTKYLMHPVYNVMGYGAAGDAVTNDHEAISDAIGACVELKKAGATPVLYFPSCTGYAINSGIIVPAGISILMDAPLLYTGTTDEIALTVGENGIRNAGIELKLNVKRGTQSTWDNQNNIGIKLINPQTAKIDIVEATGFTIGVQAMGSGAGFVYNTVNLGRIVNNKYGIDLVNESFNSAIGWSNECIYINGRISCTDGTNTGKSRYGVRLRSADTTPIYNDSNLFLKPSFELNASAASPSEAVPILIEHGMQNEFSDCRNEGNGPSFARVLNLSADNTFGVAYGVGVVTVDDKSAQPTSYVTDRKNRVLVEAKNHIFTSLALHKAACYYDGSTIVHVPGVHLRLAADATIQKALSSITMNANYLELPGFRGIGLFVTTAKNKRFVLRRDVEPGYGGQVHVQCYDANGNLLTNTGANHPYVTGEASKTPYFNANFGGVYTSNIDATEMYYFKVKDEVAYIQIVMSGGSTNPLRIRSFSVFSLDPYKSTTWVGYEEVVRYGNLAAAAPTAGTWPKGKVLYNDNKTETGATGSKYVIDGWECIATGTPGTWVAKRCLTGN